MVIPVPDFQIQYGDRQLFDLRDVTSTAETKGHVRAFAPTPL